MEIERRGTSEARVSGSASPLDGRYAPPARLTQAGQLDRQQEGSHVVRVRQLQREALEEGAEWAKAAFVELARQDALSRVNTEAKYRLHRARKESQILAGEDPVLNAEFAVLDDDLFTKLRLGGGNR